MLYEDTYMIKPESGVELARIRSTERGTVTITIGSSVTIPELSAGDAETLASMLRDAAEHAAVTFVENNSDTEPCVHCGGSGKEPHGDRHLAAGMNCLGCKGEGRMPKGYRQDRELVVEAMHHGGRYRRQLQIAQWQAAYLLGDGFGDLEAQAGGGRSYAEGAEWDWSHVRDSSPAAIARMAEYLRTALGRNATGRTA